MIVGFVCLHYGSDYLGYAIKSIYPCVDKILIAYSQAPSHGHSSDMRNPDNREACHAAAFQFGDPQNKIQWIDGHWSQEGNHRDVVHTMYPDASLVVVVDADEIWHTHELAKSIEWVMTQPVRQIKVRLRTPWRSFNWICDDQMMPDRFYRPRQEGIAYLPGEIGTFYHFGYAREPKHIEYKLTCHGHKNELKSKWFENVYMRWSPTNNIPDLHPTCVGTWNAQPFDKLLLPEVMQEHPYRSKDLIT